MNRRLGCRNGEGVLGLAGYAEQKPRALMVSEVAALLRVSERQVYKLAAENRIPYLRIAGSIRFDPWHLAAWLREQEVLGSPENLSSSFRKEARQ